MASSDFVFAIHADTNIVSEVPREHLDIYSALTELSDEQVVQLREKHAEKLFGSSTPSKAWRKDDLLAYAETHGVEVPSTANKAEILDAIVPAQEGQ